LIRIFSGVASFRRKHCKILVSSRDVWYISNDDSDHWNPMSDNPIIPQTQQDHVNVEEEGDEHVDVSYREEASPSIANKKRKACVVLDIPKKAKSSTVLIIQEQITKIAESASSFASKKVGEITIKEGMDLALECGADYSSDEHFIATQLFVKKDQREMLLTLPTNKIRFDWLTRMYSKYEN
jgi:hypothetical protein